MAEAGEPAVTRDAFYGGRLFLRQPAKGHRSGTDAVLLAAAVPQDFSGLAYDMGSGVGAVGLGIAVLRPGSRVVLVERDERTVALARGNASALHLDRPVIVATSDILDKDDLRRALPERADLVVTNPPFHDPSRSRASPDPRRRAAHMLDAGFALEDWVSACFDRLTDKGAFVAIHAAAALPELLRALDRRAGAIMVKPILPREDETAHRILVRAAKGSRAPFSLRSPLVLHDRAGRLTPEADLLHRGDAALNW